jgi:AMP nucleosidase
MTPDKNKTKDVTETQEDPRNPFLIPNPNRIYTNKRKWKIAADMLERYTGSAPEEFQKQIILTNFDHYLQRFDAQCGTSRHKGSAMSCCHSTKLGVSIVNFSIGSPTAALIIELLATVDPKAVLFLGMTGGLHRSLKKGDFIIPTAAIRDDGASQHFMPRQVPALPTFKIQKFVSQILVETISTTEQEWFTPPTTGSGNSMSGLRPTSTKSEL